jgi:hypothetical protein
VASWVCERQNYPETECGEEAVMLSPREAGNPRGIGSPRSFRVAEEFYMKPRCSSTQPTPTIVSATFGVRQTTRNWRIGASMSCVTRSVHT